MGLLNHQGDNVRVSFTVIRPADQVVCCDSENDLIALSQVKLLKQTHLDFATLVVNYLAREPIAIFQIFIFTIVELYLYLVPIDQHIDPTTVRWLLPLETNLGVKWCMHWGRIQRDRWHSRNINQRCRWVRWEAMHIVGSVSEGKTQSTSYLRVWDDGRWCGHLTNFNKSWAIVHLNWIVIDHGTAIAFSIFENDLDLSFTSLVSSL